MLWLSGKVGPLFALFVVLLIFGSISPDKFFSTLNLGNVVGQTAVIAIAAIGMTFVIISAGIDLSVGSLVALAGVYATMTMVKVAEMMPGHILIPIAAGIVVGLLTGALCGLINGAVITMGRLPPFIVTLGMLEILRGTALQSADGLPITRLPRGFSQIGNAMWTIPVGNTVIYLPYALLILIPLAILAWFLLKYTVFGMQVYAVGSNEQTARLCGVNVTKVKILVYIIGGITAGLAGILHASRLNSGQPSEAVGMELDIIAAVVVGGGSLMGGEGSILGSVVGALIIRFLRNGCVVVGVSPFVQRIIIGLIIIAAVFIDQLRRRKLSEE
ncbi:MAG: ABC transporter permease [Candidatus Omnitrophota bacterium]|jgi:ribose transport system permease protein|nr:MAG: ABC transporter permease [Candidatus Omnitrophota bacterium]